MYNMLRQSTSVQVRYGPIVNPADGVTLIATAVGTGANQFENVTTGLMLSKNGLGYAVRHATATASIYDSSDYRVTLDTTDTATLGKLRVSAAHITAYAPYWRDFVIVPANVYDSLITPGTGFLKVDIAAIATVAADAALLAANVETDLVGTVNTVVNGASTATTFSCSDITEATANHFVGKQVSVQTGTLQWQWFGTVTAYALTSGEGVFTVSPGSPTSELLITGNKVLIAS